MSEPLVSVCTPCHNAEKYVGEAVESVLNQTYKNIELIVVNDGSTDQSGKILEKYKARGVKVLTEKCGNASRARNRAFREAKGEYVKFFDADDLLSPESIEAQVGRLTGRKDAVASARWGRFYGNDPRTFRLNPETNWKDMEATEWLVESFIGCGGMMQAGMFLMPRERIEKAGSWNEKLTLIDDFEFFSRILCASREVLFCPLATLLYRSGMRGSLSVQTSRAARESECESFLLGTNHLLARRTDARARLACANVCQHAIYDFYPDHPDLRQKLATRVEECGGARIDPSGGRYFHLLRRVLGWKLARRLQRAVGR